MGNYDLKPLRVCLLEVTLLEVRLLEVTLNVQKYQDSFQLRAAGQRG